MAKKPQEPVYAAIERHHRHHVTYTVPLGKAHTKAEEGKDKKVEKVANARYVRAVNKEYDIRDEIKFLTPETLEAMFAKAKYMAVITWGDTDEDSGAWEQRAKETATLIRRPYSPEVRKVLTAIEAWHSERRASRARHKAWLKSAEGKAHMKEIRKREKEEQRKRVEPTTRKRQPRLYEDGTHVIPTVAEQRAYDRMARTVKAILGVFEPKPPEAKAA